MANHRKHSKRRQSKRKLNLQKPTEEELQRLNTLLAANKRNPPAHISTRRVLRMSAAITRENVGGGIRNVRVSKPLWLKTMSKHYYAAHVREPTIKTRTDRQATEEASKRLAKGDAKDAYGKRKRRVERTELEHIAVFK